MLLILPFSSLNFNNALLIITKLIMLTTMLEIIALFDVWTSCMAQFYNIMLSYYNKKNHNVTLVCYVVDSFFIESNLIILFFVRQSLICTHTHPRAIRSAVTYTIKDITITINQFLNYLPLQHYLSFFWLSIATKFWFKLITLCQHKTHGMTKN